MKRTNSALFKCWGFLILSTAGASLTCTANAATSAISPPEKRRAVVESASNLANPAVAAPLPAELAVPFSPPGFELSDAEERAAAAAASGVRTNVAPKVATDREILEQIAATIPPTGTIFVGDEARLIFGNKTVKIGTRFTVPLNSTNYDLELVRIDRTTFTLRLNGEEITRSIKPAKSP